MSNIVSVELTAAAITERLERYGLRPASTGRESIVLDHVDAITDGWSESIGAELLNPEIVRDEAAELERLVTSGDALIFLLGTAGGGKTAVLRQAVEGVRGQGIPVLAFRLDRMEPLSSTADLGTRLGLEVSPVAALAAIAGDRSSLLVIDQLDAVSFASGRVPRNFDVIVNLLREVTAFSDMRRARLPEV